MEVVLTRLRDFSCKETSFDECKASGMCRDHSSSLQMKRSDGDRDIETALAWLRKELMEMRSQDQALIRQLMDLHDGIQELKQECVKATEEEEEDEEGACWDSGSDGGGSSVSSSSGEMCFSSSIYSFSTCMSPAPLYLHKRAFSRRSSVP
ncbi:uncharacterized protein LOC143702615 [Siphateles boraxobius]|uniref:uncharacterized protein LOC143702615 n=1 Tax=Siphateles boraxobius TaxID=180520 RepID=UPI004062BC6A